MKKLTFNQIESQRAIGQQMSNLMYNLCQNDKIPKEYRQMMKELVVEWDNTLNKD